MRSLNILRSQKGAVDVASAAVGVLIIGIIGSVIAATVFLIIPWTQDRAAQANLDSVQTAQGSTFALAGTFKSGAALAADGTLQTTPSVAVETNTAGDCWTAIAKSGSGKLFYTTDSLGALEQLNPATNPGCVTAATVQAMVTNVGGFPGPTAAPVDPRVATCDGAVYTVNTGATITCTPTTTSGNTKAYQIVVTGDSASWTEWAVSGNWSGVTNFQSAKGYTAATDPVAGAVADTGAQTGPYVFRGAKNGSTNPADSWNHGHVRTGVTRTFTIAVDALP